MCFKQITECMYYTIYGGYRQIDGDNEISVKRSSPHSNHRDNSKINKSCEHGINVPVPHISYQHNYGNSSNTNSNTIANTSSSSSVATTAVPSAVPSQPRAIVRPVPSLVTTSIPSSTGTAAKPGFFLQYELKDQIGVGSTCKCYKTIRKSDKKEFACKVIDKKQVEKEFAAGLLEQFFVEIRILTVLKHPNIITLVDSFETNDRIYMVMEMMLGGELFDYVVEKGTLSEADACILVRKITSAVCHMHSLDIVHRDLKPENLLLTHKGSNAEVKLIDFGLAKEITGDVAKSFLGTRGYLAPEMLQRDTYGKAIDIWALGVIVFVLLCGCLPFDDDSSRINDDAIKKKFTLRFPKWATNLSSSAKDLLTHLLDINPNTRYTAEQAMNHTWVCGHSIQPNNYLQSPSMLLERRKELRSPYIKNNINNKIASGISTGLESIEEESKVTSNTSKSKRDKEFGITSTGPLLNRKNSI